MLSIGNIVGEKFTKQENDYDCGIFMMKYMADMVLKSFQLRPEGHKSMRNR